MSAHPCATTTTILDAVARDLTGGAFCAVPRGERVEYLWNGGNARRAHAALALALEAAGVNAVDVPGMGVIVKA